MVTEKFLQWDRNGNFTAHIFALGIQPHLLNVYGLCIVDELQWRSKSSLFALLLTVFVVNSLPAQRKSISKRIRYYNNSTGTFRLLLVCGDVEMNPGPNINRSSIHNQRQAAPQCRQCEKPDAVSIAFVLNVMILYKQSVPKISILKLSSLLFQRHGYAPNA